MSTRKYVARAEQWGLGETDTGKEQVAVGFQILTQDADIPYITWHGYFTDKAADRTIESLRICGWEGDDLTNLQGLDKNEVELVIEDEEYDGKVRPKVRWVNRVGGSLALKAPLSGDKLKAFAASMRGQIRAYDAGTGRKAAPKPRPPVTSSAPPHTDDDIPW